MTTPISAHPKEFNFYQPIHVRYADIDTLRHVNNVAVLEYVETARTVYYQASGIWDGEMRGGFGMVVASVKIDYLVSICYGDELRIGIKVTKLGTKSLRFRFQVERADGSTVFARGEVVMVAYNHAEDHSQPVPQDWREKLAKFENNEELLA